MHDDEEASFARASHRQNWKPQKIQELLLQSQICAHNFVQIKRSPRVVRDGGGLEARGQRALFPL
jgi:hypothetical protein